MVADVVRVLDIRDQVLACGTIHVFDARVNWKLHGNQISADLVVEPFPRCVGRPVGIRWTPPLKRLACKKVARPERQKCAQTRSLQESSSVHAAPNPQSVLTQYPSLLRVLNYARPESACLLCGRLVLSIEFCSLLQISTASRLRHRAVEGHIQPWSPKEVNVFRFSLNLCPSQIHWSLSWLASTATNTPFAR